MHSGISRLAEFLSEFFFLNNLFNLLLLYPASVCSLAFDIAIHKIGILTHFSKTKLYQTNKKNSLQKSFFSHLKCLQRRGI